MDGPTPYRVTARARASGVVVDLGIVEAVDPAAACIRALELHRKRHPCRHFPCRDFDLKATLAPLVWRRSTVGR